MTNEAFARVKIGPLLADGGQWRGWGGLDCFAALAMTGGALAMTGGALVMTGVGLMVGEVWAKVFCFFFSKKKALLVGFERSREGRVTG